MAIRFWPVVYNGQPLTLELSYCKCGQPPRLWQVDGKDAIVQCLANHSTARHETPMQAGEEWNKLQTTTQSPAPVPPPYDTPIPAAQELSIQAPANTLSPIC